MSSEDFSFELRAESIRVRRVMERHGGPIIRWRRSLVELEVLQRADGKTMGNLRRVEDFMGIARSHQQALGAYLLELNNLPETPASIVMMLNQIATGR